MQRLHAAEQTNQRSFPSEDFQAVLDELGTVLKLDHQGMTVAGSDASQSAASTTSIKLPLVGKVVTAALDATPSDNWTVPIVTDTPRNRVAHQDMDVTADEIHVVAEHAPTTNIAGPIRYAASFPHGADTQSTPGDNLQCGFYAIIMSPKLQHPSMADVSLDTLTGLATAPELAFTRGLQATADPNDPHIVFNPTKNVPYDYLAAILHQYGKSLRVDISLGVAFPDGTRWLQESGEAG